MKRPTRQSGRWWRPAIAFAFLGLVVAGCGGQAIPGTHDISQSSRTTAEAGQLTNAPSPNHLIHGAAITLPASLYAANPVGSRELITPTQANAAAIAMWQQWEHALIDRDTQALSQLTVPGPLLTGELYNCAWPTGGCVHETTPRPFDGMRMVVPVQKSYPIYFLAEIRTEQYVDGGDGTNTLTPWVELQILTKSGPSSPWRMSFDSGYDGANGTSPPPLLNFDFQALSRSAESDGTASVDMYNPPPTRVSALPSGQLLPALAQYWQSWKDSGSAPPDTIFVNDGYTSGFGATLTKNPQDSAYRGSREHFVFGSDPAAGQWTFSAAEGFPMVCGTVLDTLTNSPLTPGAALRQNSSRTNWGMPLAPGYYKMIQTLATHQACVYTVPAGLDVAGDSGFDIAVTGTPGTMPSAPLIIRYLLIVVVGGLLLAVILVVVIVLRSSNRRPPDPWHGPSGPWPPPPPPWTPPSSPQSSRAFCPGTIQVDPDTRKVRHSPWAANRGNTSRRSLTPVFRGCFVGCRRGCQSPAGLRAAIPVRARPLFQWRVAGDDRRPSGGSRFPSRSGRKVWRRHMIPRARNSAGLAGAGVASGLIGCGGRSSR